MLPNFQTAASPTFPVIFFVIASTCILQIVQRIPARGARLGAARRVSYSGQDNYSAKVSKNQFAPRCS